MKKNNWLKAVGILIIGLLLFITGRCTKKCEIKTIHTTVTLPENKGSFESPKVLVPESSNIKTVIQYKDTTIVIPQVNEELMQRYIASQKEIERLKLYTDAIAINTYKNVFDNEDINLTITSKTEGKLLEVKPEYIIKPKTIPVTIDIPKEELLFRVNAGIYSTYNQELKTFDPGLKLQITTSKNHIIEGGFSKDKNIMIGYTIPIFKINK